jgi:hypothetical protein
MAFNSRVGSHQIILDPAPRLPENLSTTPVPSLVIANVPMVNVALCCSCIEALLDLGLEVLDLERLPPTSTHHMPNCSDVRD